MLIYRVDNECYILRKYRGNRGKRWLRVDSGGSKEALLGAQRTVTISVEINSKQEWQLSNKTYLNSGAATEVLPHKGFSRYATFHSCDSTENMHYLTWLQNILRQRQDILNLLRRFRLL